MTTFQLAACLSICVIALIVGLCLFFHLNPRRDEE